MAELRQRYLDAVRELLGPHLHDQLSPSMLAEACVLVLPVDGAGISMSDPRLRVPLGWSSGDAAATERLQTTLGEGPCLTAAAQESALVADAAAIARRWPVYQVELNRQTPFCSVASVPLRAPDEGVFGALNLYAYRPDLSAVLALDDTEAMAEPMAAMLLWMLAHPGAGEPDDGLPLRLDQDSAVARSEVWVAVGMLIANSTLTDMTALARLRGFAFSHELTLDDAAHRLVERFLPVEAVLR